MHEVALVEHLLDAVQAELPTAPRSARVRRVLIHVGVLSGAHPEALRFAFDFLAPDYLGEGAALEIIEIPAVCRCQTCGTASEINEPVLLCPRCGSSEIRMEGGSELTLQEIDLDIDDDSDADATSSQDV